MGQKIISKNTAKNISFDNFDEFVDTAKALFERDTAKSITFSGNRYTEPETNKIISRFTLNWEEDETF